MNKPEYYYNNHTLLSEDLFEVEGHKEIFNILSAQYQESGSVDMTTFYNNSKNKAEAITNANLPGVFSNNSSIGGFIMIPLSYILYQLFP